ncbi:MAG: hypothetical protein LBT51_06540 [Fusobacteriaceae bacterium]|nr:hypothetical protein [Fusobacteriaceae bacterium]
MMLVYPEVGSFFIASAIILAMLKIAGDSVAALGILLIVIGIILILFFIKTIGMVFLVIGIILLIVGALGG